MLFEDPHVILDGFESLRRHHEAKRAEREDQLTRIPMKPGARVLDIGIGPGLYLPFWLEATAPQDSHFTLFDHSPEALSLAVAAAKGVGAAHRVTALQGDFFDLAKTVRSTFDVVFIGNSIEYVANPVEYLRQQIMPLLAPGGILAIRDLDCGFVNCNLVDPALNHRVVGARIRNCQQTESFHNPFVGRELQRYVVDAGLELLKRVPYLVEFAAPLTPAAVVYLSELHTKWYVEDSLGLLSPEDKATWSAAFDRQNPQSVLHQPQFYYTEAEFLVLARRPADQKH